MQGYNFNGLSIRVMEAKLAITPTLLLGYSQPHNCTKGMYLTIATKVVVEAKRQWAGQTTNLV